MMKSLNRNSLTDIGWLNQKLKCCKHEQKETKIFPENKLNALERSSPPQPQRPVLSYANLIILAIRSMSDRMMTLNEIYNWVTDTYPYFRCTGNGWKNSIRHNLSLNKCFIKVSRSEDDKGKGSYWTFDKSCLDDNGYLKTKSRTRSVHQARGSPYNQNLSPNPASTYAPMFLKTSYKSKVSQPSSKKEIESFELNSTDQICLSFPSDQQNLLSIENEPQTEDYEQIYRPENHQEICDTIPSYVNNFEVEDDYKISLDYGNKPFKDISYSMQSNLNDSFKKLFNISFENTDDEMFSIDSLRNYESLKNSVKLAGSTNWNEINLSKFPDLAEVIKDAETSKWLLDHDQVLDLAASLTKYYSSVSDIEAQSNFINLLKDPLFSKGTNYDDNFDANSLLLSTEQMMKCPSHNSAQLIYGNDEIEDDFNWESLLLI